MPDLSRGVLEDAIQMVQHSQRLEAGAKARLIGKLRALQTSICDDRTAQHAGDCAACDAGGVCRSMVQRLFAGDPPH